MVARHGGGAQVAEVGDHQGSELGGAHRSRSYSALWARLACMDALGLDSWFAQVVILIGLLVVLVLLVKQWRGRR